MATTNFSSGTVIASVWLNDVDSVVYEKVDWTSPEAHGAIGDGTTDDTTAVQAAITTGLTVRGNSGSTYLVGALTQSTARQVLIFTGSTLKLKNATDAPILTLDGDYSKVIGGSWNGNKANQSGTGANQYNHAAISVTGDYCTVEGTEVYDSFGIGLKGVACNYTNFLNNRIKDAEIHGIYVESTLADAYGNVIANNHITSTSLAASSGIYLTGSNSPFTYKQYLWSILGNICRGGTSTPTGIGITTRGVDGLIANNQTTGYTMGISADIATRTPITGNRCTDMAGASGYGIELNGAKCVVTGNYIKGGIYGVVASGNSTSQDYSVISGNIFDDPSTGGVYVVASGSYTANHLNINDNTVIFTGAGTNRAAIRLAGDCKYTHITGNKLIGPGKAVSGCRAIYLDTVVSDISINNNRISGFERPVACYHASATAYVRLSFSNNDCTQDMNSDDTFLNAEGSATIGANCVQKNNTVGSGYARHWEDRLANILELTGAGTPEGAITAGVGSRYWRTDGAATTTLYIKGSGTGNTGWTALT